jgi:hypothetical protein
MDKQVILGNYGFHKMAQVLIKKNEKWPENKYITTKMRTKNQGIILKNKEPVSHQKAFILNPTIFDLNSGNL